MRNPILPSGGVPTVILTVVLVTGLFAGRALAEDASPASPASSSTAEASSASSAPSLNPGRGQEIGLIYEAYLSPWQEGGEESDTPRKIPKMFRSTTPSLTRAEREKAGHRGHGVVRFNKDLSRASVDVAIEGVKIPEINMFHLHCGSPGVLGAILVDFSLITNLQENFADGVFSAVVDDAAIAGTVAAGHGPVGMATAGCEVPGHHVGERTPVKASTVAGMAMLAEQGQLYFNLHTTGQSYFGDMRGQLWPVR